MEHYAVCLDRSYLPRGLALHRSLRRHAGPFTLWILCLDRATGRALHQLALGDVVIVSEQEVLDEALAEVRRGRSRREYYFACKPWLVGHVLRTATTATRVTHLDGDLYYFGDPAPLMAGLSGASVALSPHRSTAALERRFGTYNAGWISFARDDDGLAALEWWRQRCTEATPDYPVDGRFGEQKYLDELAVRFHGVTAVSHGGANVAPWNVRSTSRLSRGDGGQVWIDSWPLVFFHFQGVEQWSRQVFGLGTTGPARRRAMKDAVYRPYFEDWSECALTVSALLADGRPRPAPWGSTRPRPHVWRAGRLVGRRAAALVTGSVVVVP